MHFFPWKRPTQMTISRVKSKSYFKRKSIKESSLIKYINILMLTYRVSTLFPSSVLVIIIINLFYFLIIINYKIVNTINCLPCNHFNKCWSYMKQSHVRISKTELRTKVKSHFYNHKQQAKRESKVIFIFAKQLISNI